MAADRRGGTEADDAAVPLADGGTEHRTAESAQAHDWFEDHLKKAKSAEKAGIFPLLAERSIKPFVIDRKNFLFANTPRVQGERGDLLSN